MVSDTTAPRVNELVERAKLRAARDALLSRAYLSENDRNRVGALAAAALSPPQPTIDREAIARAMYDSSPHTVISPALADVTGFPVGTILTWEAAVEAGADMSALYRYADAILALLHPIKNTEGDGK